MLNFSEQGLDMLRSMKSQLDELLSRAGIAVASTGRVTSSSDPCNGSCEGCKGCEGGCENTSKFSLVDKLTFDDIRFTLDNLETYGPLVFNREFLSELVSRSTATRTGRGG